MTASLHRIELQTEQGVAIHDLLEIGSYEHWIVPGWSTLGDLRIPTSAIRLEGLPFIPSGVGEAKFTLTAPLPDALLKGSEQTFMGRAVEVLVEGSPSLMRLRISAKLAVEHACKTEREHGNGQRRDGRSLMDPRVRPTRVSEHNLAPQDAPTVPVTAAG